MNLPVMLERYYQDTARLSFAWGEHDCALWCARWLDIAFPGGECEVRLRQRLPYSTGRAALRMLKRAGGYFPLVREFLGEPLPPLLVPVGGIALAGYLHRQALGIKAPQGVLVLLHEGPRQADPSFIIAGWPCPSW